MTLLVPHTITRSVASNSNRFEIVQPRQLLLLLSLGAMTLRWSSSCTSCTPEHSPINRAFAKEDGIRKLRMLRLGRRCLYRGHRTFQCLLLHQHCLLRDPPINNRQPIRCLLPRRGRLNHHACRASAHQFRRAYAHNNRFRTLPLRRHRSPVW